MSADSRLGMQVGNYVIKKLLGEGGMGAVYLAEHPRIGRQVAIKILSSYIAAQPQVAQRFEAEAKLITRIEHPNIIEIFDFGSLEDGSLYYIMEVLKGRELAYVIRKNKKMTPAEAWPYVEQVCAALQAAHELGVIHRDLKPENIFVLDKEPLTIKILDFGIAKLLETAGGVSLTNTGMVMGTPLFIAPEQAAGEPDRISPRTDIYSLGVMLYWMLSSKLPFTGTAPGRVMAAHISEKPPPILEHEPALPQALAALVHRCLEKEPNDRPDSVQEVAAAFAQAMEADESQAAPLVTRADEEASPATEECAATTIDPVVDIPANEEEEHHQETPARANTTTFRSATGEMTQAATAKILSKRPAFIWIGLAAGGLAIITLVGILLFSGKDKVEVGPSSNTAAQQPGPANGESTDNVTGAPEIITTPLGDPRGAKEAPTEELKPAAALKPDRGVAKARTASNKARRMVKKRPPKPRPRPKATVTAKPPPTARKPPAKKKPRTKKEKQAGEDVVDVTF